MQQVWKTALQNLISYKIIITGDGRVATSNVSTVSSLVLNVVALSDIEKRAAPQSADIGTSRRHTVPIY
jgi:hypothetical protein